MGVWLIAALLGYVLTADTAYSAFCAQGLVDVEANDQDTFESVCEAVRAVSIVLAGCGLELRHRFRVDIVERLPDDNDRHYLGFYDPLAERVAVLEFDRCQEKTGDDRRFNVAMTRPLYQSLLVHEIAHAVIEQHRNTPRLSRVAHEYAAYAIQFVAMEDELREQILTSFPHAMPITEKELSELYLDLSPPDFAVKAYLHFGMPTNGCRFLKSLLDGSRSLPSGLE